MNPADPKTEPQSESGGTPAEGVAATENRAAAEESGAARHEDHGHAHAHSHAPAMNEACRREVEVEIPTEVFSRESESVLKKYRKMAAIPGFRRGKVPESIIRSRFGEDVRTEVLEHLLPRYLRQEVERRGLQPVSQPRVMDLHVHEGEPVRFKAEFEVLPEIEPTYDGISAEKQDISVSEEEVEQQLQDFRQRQARYEPEEDRELRDGDFALVSFTGKALGSKAVVEKKRESQGAGEAEAEGSEPAAQPVEVKDVLVEIGGTNTVREFTDNLRGARPGEEREFEVAYAEDFSDQRLAGQVMRYTVQVQGVKKKMLPELNDAFAKELGSFETLEDLRRQVRESLESQKRHELEHAEKEKIVDQLLANNDFPVPQSLVERQIENRLERGLRALAAQGMRAEDMRRLNFGRLREAQQDAAVREVKAALLLDKVAEKEGIAASDEDVNIELQVMAAQSRQPLEALRQRLEEEGALDRIRDRIRNEKALDFLYNRPA